ncbi:MAG: hypothetical protein GY898_33585 [Proteobacteria bacterium]|nr:hypothetical protein [Pseudomonadota bacterium]
MHDGLLAEVPEDREEETSQVLKEAFLKAAIWVPLLGQPGAVETKTWREAWRRE